MGRQGGPAITSAQSLAQDFLSEAQIPFVQISEQQSLASVHACASTVHAEHFPLLQLRPLQHPPTQDSPAAAHSVQVCLAHDPLQHWWNVWQGVPPGKHIAEPELLPAPLVTPAPLPAAASGSPPEVEVTAPGATQ